MPRYINADELILSMRRKRNITSLSIAESIINIQPIADVVPVVYGKWTYNAKLGSFVCSNCNYTNDIDSPYCEMCGALMDEN